jgi:hypothetical protein
MIAPKWFFKLSVVLLFTGVYVTSAATVQEEFSAALSNWKAAALQNYEYSVSNSLPI